LQNIIFYLYITIFIKSNKKVTSFREDRGLLLIDQRLRES